VLLALMDDVVLIHVCLLRMLKMVLWRLRLLGELEMCEGSALRGDEATRVVTSVAKSRLLERHVKVQWCVPQMWKMVGFVVLKMRHAVRIRWALLVSARLGS
jgi:hypothetical protein